MLRYCIAFVLLAAAVLQPDISGADHVPDNLSQNIDPNYIGCLIAVDDAALEFRDILQATCIKRMVELCSGRQGVSPPSQVIDCIYFETQRAIEFLQAAVSDLPESIEKEGFFALRYEKRIDGILRDVEAAEASAKPKSIDAAIQQSITIEIAAITLLYLARETGVHLESRAAATFGGH